MVALLSLIVFLAISAHSNATYCVCKQGTSESQLQKNIDYACGAGADCNPILQSGVCYNPNTLQDHCNWAVNSYYQKKGQATGTCDFSATAITSSTSPSQSSSCVYPAGPGTGGTPPSIPGPPPPPDFGTGNGTFAPPGVPPPPGGFGIAPSGTTYPVDNSGGILTSDFAITISLSILASWLITIMS